MAEHDPKPERVTADTAAADVDRAPRLSEGESASPPADEEEGIRQLLRGSLTKDSENAPDVLSGVQRKLRQRSQGKFYRDGWSTSREPPIQTYLITSLVMLAFSLVVYAILSPLSGAAEVAEPTAPVKIVPPTLLPGARP